MRSRVLFGGGMSYAQKIKMREKLENHYLLAEQRTGSLLIQFLRLEAVL